MRSRIIMIGLLAAGLSVQAAGFAQTDDQDNKKKAGAVVPGGDTPPGTLPAGGAAGQAAPGFSIGTPEILLGVAALAGVAAFAAGGGGSNHNNSTPSSTTP
jgi:hypothetical protein